MNKKTMLLLASVLLFICSSGVYAEHFHDWYDDHEYEKYNDTNHKHQYICYDCDSTKFEIEPHDWRRASYDDRKYDSTYHYACYECKNCEEKKYVLEKHSLESLPSDYRFWDENTCNAQYRCEECHEYIPKSITHKWIPCTGNYEYSYVDKTYHKKTRYCECSQCNSTRDIGNNEKHTFKYHKSSGFIYFGCNKCQYRAGNKSIPAKWTIKTTTKKGKKGTTTVPLLAKDKIKSFKVISGKALISVKKKSNSKLFMITKKKGTAKLKVTTKSGAVYKYIIKIK